MEKVEDEISLRELIEKLRDWYRFLLSKWKVIVIAGFIGASLGLVYSFVKTPIYKAKLSFAAETEKSSSLGGLGGALGLASSFGVDLGGGGGSIFSGPNLLELFKSRLMIERALLSPVVVKGKKISLAEMYIQINDIRKGWEDKPKLRNIRFLPDNGRKGFTRVHDSILEKIYDGVSNDNNLSVSQKDKKIAITTIEVKSNNELFSKYYCETLAKEVGTFYTFTVSKKARANMEILIKQRDSVRNELNKSIEGVAIASDNNFGVSPAQSLSKAPYIRKQIDMKTNEAVLMELVKQTEMAKVALRKETPLIQVIDRPIFPLEKDRLGKAKGIVLGGFLFGFLTGLCLIVKRIFAGAIGELRVMNEE